MISLKKIKKKTIKQQPVITDESYQFKNLLIIIIVIVVLLVPLYFITKLVVKNNDEDKTVTNTTEAVIQNEKILVGQLFNRPQSEYYVLAYKSDNKFITLFDNYISDYTSKEDSLTFYKINLDEGLNKQYIKDETNISDDLNELKLSDTTLIKIKDGKIENYYIGNDDVVEILKEING